jgi:hypothetical protein
MKHASSGQKLLLPKAKRKFSVAIRKSVIVLLSEQSAKADRPSLRRSSHMPLGSTNQCLATPVIRLVAFIEVPSTRAAMTWRPLLCFESVHNHQPECIIKKL